MNHDHESVWDRYRHAQTDHQRQLLLISARKAVATPPGAVPEVWAIYRWTDDASIAAEHLTMGIWATHQRGIDREQVHLAKSDAVSRPTNFGGACRRLFDAQFSGDTQVRSPIDTLADDTISKRLAVLSRTDEVNIAVSHATSLVRLMRSTGTSIGFNYDDLYWAIRTWTDLERRTAVLYQWSRSYFHATSEHTTESVGTEG